ncbi:acyl-CoA dehydratase activase [candidate division KSB1 bacterium]
MMKKSTVYIGLDVGSISVKAALLSIDKEITASYYRRHSGQPVEAVVSLLQDISKEHTHYNFSGIAVTGTAGTIISEALETFYCNEVIAAARGISELYPIFRTVIEMGGEDSKLLVLKESSDGSGVTLEDFAMNSACAAGTGSFLDQQASRLQLNIENEFGDLAIKSENPPHIAGRCSVFAKSDMIHLQQIGTPDYDIVAGLCFAVARNFQSTIGNGAQFTKPVAFIGGVASNKGMVRAFTELLGLSDKELIIPEYHTCLGAIGAAIIGMENRCFKDEINVENLLQYDPKARKKVSYLKKLQIDLSHVVESEDYTTGADPKDGQIEAFIGIDIGSVSTNVVVLNSSRQVLARRYLPTAGRPIEAVKNGLKEIGDQIGSRLRVMGVGTTGSGRYMIADLVGADIVRNEITAQARGALAFDPSVDTIFEIGGQDSKFIALEDGVVIDFAMNKVCAAGTGSFLEEQAERLDINIKKQFETVACSCESPVKLGERCTVFIESDLISQQQAGASKKELVSGLAYSVVRNYLNRVVDKGRIGNNIFFQGGTANNKAVVAAFEKVLNKKITVPPHNDVTGAIGIALLAQENSEKAESRWKGFGFVDQEYTLSSFVCKTCSNHCEVKRVKIEKEKPLFYGSRCERFDYDKKIKRGEALPNLFDLRERLLLGPYYDKQEGVKRSQDKKQAMPLRRKGEIRIGIPRLLQFHENFPYWRAFFESLGWTIVLSQRTSRSIVHKGAELVNAEFCFPVKVAHGHIDDLLGQDIDALFLPSLINHQIKANTFSNSYNCPFIQGFPYVIGNIIDFKHHGIITIEPHIAYQRGEEYIRKELYRALRSFSVRQEKINRALLYAEQAQNEFRKALLKIGQETLGKIESGEYGRCLLIIGRSYNTCDDGLNLNIPKKLRDLGTIAIPMECLPVEKTNVHEIFPNTYWKYGQKILGAGELIRKNKNLFGVYITNFGCGPDSMIQHLFKETLGEKPYLQLEIDEHSADAGIMTRCEAYLDSLDSIKGRKFPEEIHNVPTISMKKDVTLYLPYMCNHAYPMAAAFRNCGINAEVLPEPTDESAELGRQFTNGKECFPCIVTMGDLTKKVTSPDFDRKRSAFFIPTASGPCRFGKYSMLHRLALNNIGFDDVPIMSPGSHNSYADFDGVNGDFRRKGWISFVITDALEKLLREVRPYEDVKGTADRIFDETMKDVCCAIEKGEEIIPILEDYRSKMASVPQTNGSPRVVIGMVGEIYLRLNKFSNDDVIGKLEDFGAEVRLAPMGEWIFYTNSQHMHFLKEEKLLKEYLINWFKNHVQARDEHKYLHPLKKTLRYSHDPPVNKILKYSAPYMHRSFGGEAILSVGKSIDYIRQGARGIVNVMPFTCMPGIVVSSMSKKIRENFGNVPWLNLFYDGQQDEISVRTQIETFVHQARSYEPIKHKKFTSLNIL